MRQSGILMHISSLPGPGGIGSLGQEAYDFADFLKAAGMKIWQVLPMGPTGYGESPYQSSSVFAGNPLLISTRKLYADGLLDYDFNEEYNPENKGWVNYPMARENKEYFLRMCFSQSKEKVADEVAAYVKASPWLEDFALFTAVKHHFNDMMWTKWPDEEIRLHKKNAVKKYQELLDEEIRYHIFCQYLFHRQWVDFKAYVNSLGISLFGDMPIYVAEDSADTWTHPEVFQLDRDRIPTRVAGVPPDLFSEDGQLWGNPLYRWKYLENKGFGWWVDRMRHMNTMYDIVRVDHFIGFANYYSIPHGAENARNGKWIVGPGGALFDKLNEEIPGMQIVAEDLGVVNDRVRRLLDYVGYPGMRVLAFGFGGGAKNPHRHTNYVKNSVAYTGTHDNDTVIGWVNTADEASLADAKKTLKFTTPEEAPEAFIRAVLRSKSETAVLLMQDVLGLDGLCRMNLPGTIGNNWVWRMEPGVANSDQAARLLALNTQYKRNTKRGGKKS